MIWPTIAKRTTMLTRQPPNFWFLATLLSVWILTGQPTAAQMNGAGYGARATFDLDRLNNKSQADADPARSDNELDTLSVNLPDEHFFHLRRVLQQITERRVNGEGVLFADIPQAEENTQRFVESGIDTFVVGRTANTTDMFRDIALLTKIEGPYSPGQKLKLRPDRGICSAVVISDVTLLTAAHCVCSLNLDRERGRLTTAAVWGKAIIEKDSITPSQTAMVASRNGFRLYIQNFCETFRSRRTLAGPDIALVYLDQEFVKAQREDAEAFVHRPAVIAPPSLYLSRHLSFMTVVGYGLSVDQDTDADKPFLPKVGAVVPVADVICGRADSQNQFNCRSGQEIVLIDRIFGNDTCNGDSGGPAYIRHYEKYYLAGITSRAAKPGTKCGSGGIYTLLTPHLATWIHRHTRVVDPTF